ncbi:MULTISPECIES: Trk system potassium transporter TrkA [unclassified Roseitalea]|uniref:Trk system potassium transporter TrkA n=1 Tax=unclassified Roseitalea TaxID=2639107 RepID=UPI00273EEC4E|nr:MULTISPECIES: Trk system potassium transporter TrkA [unclassified Roseitalea]
MRVIICGAGQVGFGIAERLSSEDNDVSVIDTSHDLIARVRDTLDVRGVVGHGSHPDVMAAAGADEAEMIIAVTLYDEVNMTACQVAHSLFEVPTKIARVRAQSYLHSHYSNLFSRDNLPIDVIISPEREVGEVVLRRIALPGATDVVEFADGQVVMMAIECREDCPVINTPLSQLTDLFPDLNATVVGVWRNDKLFVPHSSDQLLADDLVYVISVQDQVRRTLSLFGHEETEARRIVIAGGGNIGHFVASELEKGSARTNTKIIERNRERAIKVADTLRRTIVLNGSALDQQIMHEADIQDAELMVALTNDDQVNVLCAVMAKNLGCQATMSLINDLSYQSFTATLGIDAHINPRAVTISRVLQHMRRGRIRQVHSVQKGQAEVLEAEALETSPLVGTPLRDLDLPEDIRIGAVYREGKVMKPDGETQIRAHDRVVIFAKTSAVKKVEQLFRVSLQFF